MTCAAGKVAVAPNKNSPPVMKLIPLKMSVMTSKLLLATLKNKMTKILLTAENRWSSVSGGVFDLRSVLSRSVSGIEKTPFSGGSDDG